MFVVEHAVGVLSIEDIHAFGDRVSRRSCSS